MNDLDPTPTFLVIGKSKNNSKYLLRLIYRSILVVLLAYIFLGFAFSLIAQSIILCAFILATIWKPAYIVISRFLSFEEPEEDYVPMRSKWYYVLGILLITTPNLLPMVGGILMLIDGGFCSQNLFCAFIR